MEVIHQLEKMLNIHGSAGFLGHETRDWVVT